MKDTYNLKKLPSLKYLYAYENVDKNIKKENKSKTRMFVLLFNEFERVINGQKWSFQKVMRTDARRRVCAAMVPYRWATRGTSLRELEHTHISESVLFIIIFPC